MCYIIRINIVYDLPSITFGNHLKWTQSQLKQSKSHQETIQYTMELEKTISYRNCDSISNLEPITLFLFMPFFTSSFSIWFKRQNLISDRKTVSFLYHHWKWFTRFPV